MHRGKAIVAVVVRVMILLSAVGSTAQGPNLPQGPPIDTLTRTRERLLPEMEGMPRYTCVQTIYRRYYSSRHWFRAPSCSTLISEHASQTRELPLSGWDRLRLEVAVVEGKIVYSWLGAPRFDAGAFEKLAGRGPLGTGDFGAFVVQIFNRSTIIFKGEVVKEGKRLFEYSYELPAGRSSYRIETYTGWHTTGYSGLFRLDPEQNDLVSLTVTTSELPRSSPVCQVTTEVEFLRTPIREHQALIPHETRLLSIGRDGNEANSLTLYSGCREYSSTSRILLDGAGGGSNPAAASDAAPQAEPIPSELHFEARITTPIDSDTAAAGDPIEAVLRSPLRNKKHKVLAPAGARLTGRITRLEQSYEPDAHFILGVQLETIEIAGRKTPIGAVSYHLTVQPLIGGFRSGEVTHAETRSVGIFYFRGKHLQLKDFDTEWITAPPNGKAKG